MTKELHLFAIGNALVDVQIQISHDDFDTLTLIKGGMALVSPDEQRLMLERFLHLPASKSSGGSAANTVIAFAQFGGRAGYGSVLGKDDHGLFYASEFDKLGIELFAELTSSADTGTCLVLITPDAERTMNTALAVNTRFSKEHLSEEAIKRAEWLYIEGYKFTEKTGAEAIDRAIFYAKKYDTKIAVTFSDTFIVQFFDNELRKAVQQADLIFANETEAQTFTGETDNAKAFRALQSVVPNVAMTLGGNGSQIFWNGREVRVAAHQTEAIDTTGAGDMFAGGFLYGITHNYTPEKAGNIAAVAASKVISQLGARITNEEFQLLKNHLFQ